MTRAIVTSDGGVAVSLYGDDEEPIGVPRGLLLQTVDREGVVSLRISPRDAVRLFDLLRPLVGVLAPQARVFSVTLPHAGEDGEGGPS